MEGVADPADAGGVVSRPLVSADDVREARRRRATRLEVPPDAIVTPLARDEAARWGIDLVEGEPPGRRTPRATPPSSTRPRAATCDPDDVERVVRRVLDRVPHADPAQVREIARRALEQPS